MINSIRALRMVWLRKGGRMRCLASSNTAHRRSAGTTAGDHVVKRRPAGSCCIAAVTVLHSHPYVVTVSGGEGANRVVTGPTITGAKRGLYGCDSSPTVSHCHFLRNLSVGREGLPHAASRGGGPELAGDTKPTIANSTFAADYISVHLSQQRLSSAARKSVATERPL